MTVLERALKSHPCSFQKRMGRSWSIGSRVPAKMTSSKLHSSPTSTWQGLTTESSTISGFHHPTIWPLTSSKTSPRLMKSSETRFWWHPIMCLSRCPSSPQKRGNRIATREESIAQETSITLSWAVEILSPKTWGRSASTISTTAARRQDIYGGTTWRVSTWTAMDQPALSALKLPTKKLELTLKTLKNASLILGANSIPVRISTILIWKIN